MRKLPHFLAKFIFWFHWTWISFSIGAFFLSFRSDLYKKIFIVMVVLTFIGQILFKGECPITILENKFRRKTGQPERYQNGFFTYHLFKYFKIRLNHVTATTFLLMMLVISVIG